MVYLILLSNSHIYHSEIGLQIIERELLEYVCTGMSCDYTYIARHICSKLLSSANIQSSAVFRKEKHFYWFPLMHNTQITEYQMLVTPDRSQWIFTQQEIEVKTNTHGVWDKDILHLFACDCVEQLTYMIEENEINVTIRKAIDISRRYANGETTDKELNEAAYGAIACSNQCIKALQIFEYYATLSASFAAGPSVKANISSIRIAARYIEYSWLSTRLWEHLNRKKVGDTFNIEIVP